MGSPGGWVGRFYLHSTWESREAADSFAAFCKDWWDTASVDVERKDGRLVVSFDLEGDSTGSMQCRTRTELEYLAKWLRRGTWVSTWWGEFGDDEDGPCRERFGPPPIPRRKAVAA